MNRNYREPIPISDIHFSGNEIKYVTDAMASTWISSSGPYINKFESKFANFCGTHHAVSTSNGTTALHLAIESLNIGPGDEVIIPTLTFAATANAVIHANATPVFVDSLENHWNMDPEQIRLAITPKTKAIIPVHLYGHPCDMDKIMNIAQKHRLYVIEDCAEAPGAIVNDKKVGSIGNIGCFSFYGNKIITTGEGGICTTDDLELNERMRILRDHGMDKNKRYWHNEVGYNYRMTNINAAIGFAQMEQIEDFIQKRSQLKKIYDTNIIFGSKIMPPVQSYFGQEVDWMYCLIISSNFPDMREFIMNELAKSGIDSRPFFFPLHLMPPYQKYLKKGMDFPNAEAFGKYGLNLPLYPTLLEEDIQHITKALNKTLADI